MTRLPDPFATRAIGAGRSADRMSRTGHLDEARRERWQRGAAGERATAALLEPLALAGWVVLHDRRVPGMVANIDHLVAGTSTLWVLDTKVWRGDIVRLSDGQLWYGDAPVHERTAVVGRIGEAVKCALARHAELAYLDVRVASVIQGTAEPPDLATVDGVALLHLEELVAQIVSDVLPGAPSPGSLHRLDQLFPARAS